MFGLLNDIVASAVTLVALADERRELVQEELDLEPKSLTTST